MDLFYISIIGGIIVGTITSLIFIFYKTADIKHHNYKLFNIPISNFILDVMAFVLVAATIFLTTVSFYVKDFEFPKNSPYLFTLETFLMTFLPAIAFICMFWFRGHMDNKNLITEFIIFAAHFTVFHLLFQFTGAYSHLFSR